MEFVEDNDFNELILNFKKLSIIEKKQLTISEIKIIIAVLNALNLQNNHNSKTLFNCEVVDVNEMNYAEEDFIEAIYVYIYSIKELLADLVLDTTENLE